METVYYIVFVPMVYLAAAVFFFGIAVRLAGILRAPRNATSLQIYPEKKPRWLLALYDTFFFPTVRRHKPLLWVFLIVFHIGLLLLLIGHIELLGDFAIFQIIPHEVFIGKGLVGVAVIICLLYFLFRRFHGAVRELSVPEDYLLLILLLLTALFGSQMDWARTWYGYQELMPSDYREYLLSLIALHPKVPYTMMSTGHAFMMVLHVFCANLFLMVFPFSQLMHAIFALPMNKLRRG
ncbi:MAG: respiratory nitrate reductase subunit gamma [Desulfobacteraceae bacterium]|nr:respiratory nitrate reductase subunit gamma [Desulfobacteraceae bacterium]